MRVVVTGATGDLGRRVVSRLAGQGHLVTRAARRPEGASDVAYRLGDPLAMDGADAVVHLASDPTVAGRDLDAMETLVATATATGLPHLVFISIVGIDEHPLPYYRSKLAQEHLLLSSPVPATVVRATQFHTFLPKVPLLLGGGPSIVVPKGYRLQPVDPDAVADRLVGLVEGPPSGRVRDLGGPQVLDVATALGDHATRRGLDWDVRSEPPTDPIGRAFAASLTLLGPEGEVIGASYDDWVRAHDRTGAA